MDIGIFGGSFNPIHCGHIALAQAIREQCRLDTVWLMVSPQNPLKQQSELLCDADRYQLACQALQSVEGVEASDYEMQLPRPTYTWHTMQQLSAERPTDRLHLIIGGDNWAHFERWYRAEDLLASYPIIVYPRRGDTLPEAPRGARVRVVEAPLLDVSSTEVRRRVRARQSIRGLVPEPIVASVEQLYAHR